MMAVLYFFALSTILFLTSKGLADEATAKEQIQEYQMGKLLDIAMKTPKSLFLNLDESYSRQRYWPNIQKRGGSTALMDLLDYVGKPNRKGRKSSSTATTSKQPKTPVESWIWNNILFKDKGT